MTVTAVQIVLNHAFCSVRQIYDLCAQRWGEYGLSGCVSQAPDYTAITTSCDQNWGFYGLAGCVSYVAVKPHDSGVIGTDGVIGMSGVLGG